MFLWDSKHRFKYLLFVSLIIFLAMLGAKEIWTQEWRWATICQEMLWRHDFFHPYLIDQPYYDKPLLSYWLILLASFITRSLDTFALRLPNALMGLLGVWSMYQIGKAVINQRVGLIAAWLWITTPAIVFWARTASADMLNTAGILFALAYYFKYCRNSALVWANHHSPLHAIIHYSLFFIIIALTALCKGLIAPVVVFIALLPELFFNKNFRQQLFRPALLLALFPAFIIYFLPFYLSTHFNTQNYSSNGLYLVFRENILRYFQPFDHQEPFYVYFIYLPLYLLPWVFFFVPALFQPLKVATRLIISRSKISSLSYFFIVTLSLFIFLTISGSRRSYYILPLLPFALLLTAQWIAENKLREKIAYFTTILMAALLILIYSLLLPMAYSHGGIENWVSHVKKTAHLIQPELSWEKWQVILWNTKHNASFYLHSKTPIKFTHAPIDTLSFQKNHIIILPTKQQQNINPALVNHYRVISMQPPLYAKLLPQPASDENVIALIPN